LGSWLVVLRSFLRAWPADQLAQSQIETQIELQLVVVWLHVATELVESPVMIALLEMGQLMDDDHAQELGWHLLEQAGDPDLTFGLDPVALDPRNLAVEPESICRDVYAVVKHHLGRRLRIAQEAAFQGQGVFIERFTTAYRVRSRVLGAQHGCQVTLSDRLPDLPLKRFGITREVP